MSFFSSILVALTTIVEPPAPSEDFDGESSTNVVLAIGSNGNTFRLTFDVETTISNNVEIAFGVDRDQNGELATDEFGLLVGWRGGRWVAFDMDGECTEESPAVDGVSRFVWSVYLDEDGRPQKLMAMLNGVKTFSRLTSQTPSGAFNPQWNLARVFVRGKGTTSGRIQMRRLKTGLIICVQ